MNKLITIALVALCLGAGAYVGGYLPFGNDAPTRVTGWIDGKCLAIEKAGLVTGTPVAVAVLDDDRTIASAKITGSADGAEDCVPLMEDRKANNATDGMAFYTLDGPDTDAFAIGVVPAEGQALDTNADGTRDTFDFCVTGEGIQFTSWSGEANKSDKLWSGYYYLGYDSEPTCPAG